MKLGSSKTALRRETVFSLLQTFQTFLIRHPCQIIFSMYPHISVCVYKLYIHIIIILSYYKAKHIKF